MRVISPSLSFTLNTWSSLENKYFKVVKRERCSPSTPSPFLPLSYCKCLMTTSTLFSSLVSYLTINSFFFKRRYSSNSSSRISAFGQNQTRLCKVNAVTRCLVVVHFYPCKYGANTVQCTYLSSYTTSSMCRSEAVRTLWATIFNKTFGIEPKFKFYGNSDRWIVSSGVACACSSFILQHNFQV